MLPPRQSFRRGHTLVELVTAMSSGAILLAGLGSVMMIASQVANTPIASNQRLEAAEAVNELANDVRFATFFHAHTPRLLDFSVADRNGDGTAERIRYAWSGVPGEPLFKTTNGGTPVAVVESVQDLQLSLTTSSKVESYTVTADSAETLLASNTSASGNSEYNINYTNATQGQFAAQRIDPTTFAGKPAGATSWNLTRVEFQARQGSGGSGQHLRVQVRSSGEPDFRPTSELLGEIVIPETTITGSSGTNTATFASPIRSLALHRGYDIVWTGTKNESGDPARLLYFDSNGSNVRQANESTDGGATWQVNPDRRYHYRLYGTYSSPGATYNVTRSFASRVNVVLQTGEAGQSRNNSSVPLVNQPELLSAYWRTDFDTDPTTLDVTGDTTRDWATNSGGAFSGASGGIWYASGALESRAKSDFTTVTTIDARCRNTSVGGNGAVIRIQADRQGGTHAPLEVRIQKQADASQTLSLYGKSNDATDVQLFERKNLSSDFVRVRLTILPANNVVNLKINDVDEGTYSYPTYVPANDNRFLTCFADTSSAEFDYVEMRVAE